jgi:hypothetical protein
MMACLCSPRLYCYCLYSFFVADQVGHGVVESKGDVVIGILAPVVLPRGLGTSASDEVIASGASRLTDRMADIERDQALSPSFLKKMPIASHCCPSSTRQYPPYPGLSRNRYASPVGQDGIIGCNAAR